jgi:hypothetical protein
MNQEGLWLSHVGVVVAAEVLLGSADAEDRINRIDTRGGMRSRDRFAVHVSKAT